MTDEELIEQVARDIEAVKCGLNYDYMDFCRDAARAILPIIKAERIRGGEMVKEAAIQKSYAWCPSHTGLNTVGDWLRKDLCALSVPAIVEAGDADL